jgi:ankyrin repeat protein
MRSGLKPLLAWGIVSLVSAASVAAEPDRRLLEAVKAGNVESVRALLKQRMDVNAPDGDGSTPLHWAVHRDNAVVVDLLMRAGARPQVANDLGVTPLYLGCTNRNANLIRKLLAAGANPNAALLRGETVLMECARAGSADGVKALAARGADVNARDLTHGQTALMWAASQAHASVVEALVELGADLRARSRVYTQYVKNADRTANREPVTTVERGGSTPLLFAVRAGDVESVRLLVAAGADVNDALPDGMSAHAGRPERPRRGRRKGRAPDTIATGCCSGLRDPAREGPSGSRRQPERRDRQSLTDPPRQSGFRIAHPAGRRDALPACGQVSRSRHHASVDRRRRRSEARDAERRNGADDGGWRVRSAPGTSATAAGSACDGAGSEDAGRAASGSGARGGNDVNAIIKAGDTATRGRGDGLCRSFSFSRTAVNVTPEQRPDAAVEAGAARTTGDRRAWLRRKRGGPAAMYGIQRAQQDEALKGKFTA